MQATASIAGASGIIGSTLARTAAADGRAVCAVARHPGAGPTEIMTNTSRRRKRGLTACRRNDESCFGLRAQWRADRLIP